MLTTKLILERLDKEGRLLQRKEQLSKSFTKGFLELLYITHAQIGAAAPYSMTDIDGNARDIDSEATYDNFKATLMMGSAPGNSQVIALSGGTDTTSYLDGLILEAQKVGIQVGTGTTAATPTDTSMETRIAHGRSAGELEYGGCELVGITFSDPNGEFTIRRYFTNASGGSITVNEVGLHAVGCLYDVSHFGDSWVFLVAHDVVSPGVAVANGEILRVTYVPQITV